MTNLNRNEEEIQIEPTLREVAIKIEERLSQTELPKRTKWCIYKVPNEIRELNKDAYTPWVVSIGPFHYGDERLQNGQNYKWEYLKKFVQRSGTKVDDLVTSVEGLESNVRCCYAENIMFDKKQLIEIILLDACFIIELFLGRHLEDWSKDDSFSRRTRVASALVPDLLLIENQLPFFVFEKLFNRTFPSESSNLPSFLELTFKYFGYFNIQGLNPNDVESVDIRHFTDLLRYFYLQPPSRRQQKRIEETERLNFTATELQEAGLKFEVNTSRCSLELQFSGCVLKIPKILVEDLSTERLFRNMVAFEQCHCPFDAYITDYVAIFDFLVDTDKDVDVLIQNGIILNYMDDSSAVAKMFNGLSKNVEWPNCNSDYFELCKKLNEFYNNPRRKLKATLRRDYCSTPWKTVASIAGIVLLFLALVQTICSVIPVIQKA